MMYHHGRDRLQYLSLTSPTAAFSSRERDRGGVCTSNGTIRSTICGAKGSICNTVSIRYSVTGILKAPWKSSQQIRLEPSMHCWRRLCFLEQHFATMLEWSDWCATHKWSTWKEQKTEKRISVHHLYLHWTTVDLLSPREAKHDVRDLRLMQRLLAWYHCCGPVDKAKQINKKVLLRPIYKAL